jgi:hypothetical protein
MTSRKLLLLQIYLYLVCLVAAVTFLFVVGNGLWGVVGIALPRLTVNEHDYKIVSSFEYYKHARPKMERAPQEKEIEPVDDAELRRRWEEEKQLILDAEQRGGLREFVRMWVWMIILVPIYVFHWRAAKRLKGPVVDPAKS